MHILLAEDDHMAGFIVDQLAASGHLLAHVIYGAKAVQPGLVAPFDLGGGNRMLPELDGFRWCANGVQPGSPLPCSCSPHLAEWAIGWLGRKPVPTLIW